MMSESITEQANFDKTAGLLPVVVQHFTTGQVLMVGYVNRETLRESEEGGRLVFFSRSRKQRWLKGESSSNYLNIREIKLDCDRDAALVLAEPEGPTCHTGERSCFGKSGGSFGFLGELEKIVLERRDSSDTASYTSSLFKAGLSRIAQKVGEEAVEVVLASQQEDKSFLREESADLIFHLLVLLAERGVSLEGVVAELVERHQARHPAQEEVQD